MDEVYEGTENVNMVKEGQTAEELGENQENKKAKDRQKRQDASKINQDVHSESASNIDFLLDIPLEITIELDRTTMLINEMLKLGQGSILELSKFAGETLDVLANQRLIAKGEVVVINDKYGIRLTEIISPMERLVRLK